MKKFFLFLLLIFLVGLGVWLSAFQVPEGRSAIVARFGNPQKTIDEPGLYFKLPDPVDVVTEIDRRVHVLDPGANEYLTSDKKNVIVDCFMAWRVHDTLKYWVSVTNKKNAEARLTDVLRSTVGDVLSAHPFSDLVSHEKGGGTLSEVAEEITRQTAEESLRDFGIMVDMVRVKRLNFPTQNKDAVFRRMEQERDSISSAIRSEGREEFDRIKADADREEATLIAEAERKAKERRGSADAEVVRIFSEAYAKDPALYKLVRRLKVLEGALGESAVIVLPSDHELLRVLQEPPRRQETEGDHD